MTDLPLSASAADGAAASAAAGAAAARPTLLGHVRIARVDHWAKNVFVLPGIVAAAALVPSAELQGLPLRAALALLAVGLVASSNYTLNEILDAPFDRHHPRKRDRPVPAGEVSIPLAYLQWWVLGMAGVALGYLLGTGFVLAVGGLWVMGIVYNVPPLRSKDHPYLDVLSEAVNNPLRMLAGWFLVADGLFAPATLLLSYWMVGCYFMAIKRYAEVRQIGDPVRVAAYRRSLAFFTPERMLVAVTFYGAAAMLFFGAFIMRYRLELILTFPLVALVMSRYLALGFEEDSAAQHPEKLYRSPGLMTAVVACALLMGALLVLDLPWLHVVLSPDYLPLLK